MGHYQEYRPSSYKALKFIDALEDANLKQIVYPTSNFCKKIFLYYFRHKISLLGVTLTMIMYHQCLKKTRNSSTFATTKKV